MPCGMQWLNLSLVTFVHWPHFHAVAMRNKWWPSDWMWVTSLVTKVISMSQIKVYGTRWLLFRTPMLAWLPTMIWLGLGMVQVSFSFLLYFMFNLLLFFQDVWSKLRDVHHLSCLVAGGDLHRVLIILSYFVLLLPWVCQSVTVVAFPSHIYFITRYFTNIFAVSPRCRSHHIPNLGTAKVP